MSSSHPLEMSIRMDDIPGKLDIFAMTPTLMDGNLSSQNPIRPLYTFGYEYDPLDEWILHYEFIELDEYSDGSRLRLAALRYATNFYELLRK